MYRSLLMFPRSADPAQVATLIDAITESFSASAGFRVMTRSVGAIMGPSAKDGHVGWIVEVDHATLDDVMAALQADEFREVQAAVEALGTSIFLYEVAAH